MSLWENIAADITAATGQQSDLQHQGAVGGGCINQAARVRFAGIDYFVKLNHASQVDMFAAEADGLNEPVSYTHLTLPTS